MRGNPAVAVALALAALAAPGALDAQAPAEQPLATAGSPLDGLRRARDAFAEVGDFSAALGAAENVVDEQRAQPEPLLAADLATLGLIQAELRKTDDAIDNLVEAIEIVVDDEGEYSSTLIEYYRGLGRAYIKSAQYQQAIVTLEQAQHISQRHLGLFNVEQAALLDDITTAYLGLGNTVDAQKTQLERLDNAIRRCGADDPRVIPFRYTLARYYEQSRLPESAREQYEEVLTAQESRLGNSHAGLLAPLRELAALDLLVSQGVNPERRDRLAAVLEENPSALSVERGRSRAFLGDWASVPGDAAAARGYYREAWSALQADTEGDAAAYFRKPTMIDFVAPLSAVDRAERSRPYTWTEIVLEFDVSAEGLPSGVRVVTRDPQTTTLQTRYSRRMRETHFRPRLVDGEPVATSNVRSTHYVRRYVNKAEEQAEDE